MKSGHAKFTAMKISRTSQENASTKLFWFNCKLGAKPGQFVMAWLPGVSEKPLSVAFENDEGFALLVSAVGDFSKKFNELKEGDKVWIRGPFGNNFERKGNRLVLIGGGFGVAPMWFFASQNKEAKITFIQGARNKDVLLLQKELTELGVDLRITTDDGSVGVKGFTTDALNEILEKEKVDCVYACGPEKMLHKIVQACNDKGVECQVSVERHMKCGFGVCGQCALDEWIVCRDGPIFTGEQLKENKEFGVHKREPSGQKVSI